MITFQLKYFRTAVILLTTEVLIALFAHDQIIRPFGGDVLVVILLYCMIKSVARLPVIRTALSALIFACLVEAMQYFDTLEYLGLNHSKTANILLGNSFSWLDILAYTLGSILTIGGERFMMKKNSISKSNEPLFI